MSGNSGQLRPRVVTQVIHGHRRAYVRVGSGPAVLLLHGLGADLNTWDRVIAPLARHHTVIAPDLLGHGQSAKPRADYSVGGYANGVRDLLSVLGVERATVVGHSFGGGVAMQFAYQYPERCERLVLAASGGLGAEVTPLLRLFSLPGGRTALAVATTSPLRQAVVFVARLAAAFPGVDLRRVLPALRDTPELMAGFEALAEPAARSAFLHVLRAVVDAKGQVVTMQDRGYLAAAMPVLLVWGTEDPVIPESHATRGATILPGSRVVRMEGVGHFPHRDRPAEFVRVVEEFIATTHPAIYDAARFRGMLRRGAPAADDPSPPAQSA